MHALRALFYGTTGFQYQSCAKLGGHQRQGGTLKLPTNFLPLDILRTSLEKSSPSWLSSCRNMSDSTSDPGSITNPVKFKNQEFESLCDECRKSGKLFLDPSFPADQNSIGMPADPDPKMVIKWLRPKVSIYTQCVFFPTGSTIASGSEFCGKEQSQVPTYLFLAVSFL